MKKGFTLIELLAAVLVIGVLSAIAVPQYQRSVERARMMEGIQMLPAIYDSLQRWQAENPDKDDLPDWNMLDISMKGTSTFYTYKEDLPVWLTHEFAYLIFRNDRGSDSPGQKGEEFVLAAVRRGKYKGNGFMYMPGENILNAFSGNAQIYCAPMVFRPLSIPDACAFMGFQKERDAYPQNQGDDCDPFEDEDCDGSTSAENTPVGTMMVLTWALYAQHFLNYVYEGNYDHL